MAVLPTNVALGLIQLAEAFSVQGAATHTGLRAAITSGVELLQAEGIDNAHLANLGSATIENFSPTLPSFWRDLAQCCNEAASQLSVALSQQQSTATFIDVPMDWPDMALQWSREILLSDVPVQDSDIALFQWGRVRFATHFNERLGFDQTTLDCIRRIARVVEPAETGIGKNVKARLDAVGTGRIFLTRKPTGNLQVICIENDDQLTRLRDASGIRDLTPHDVLIGFNPDYVTGIDDAQLQLDIVHELRHVAFDKQYPIVAESVRMLGIGFSFVAPALYGYVLQPLVHFYMNVYDSIDGDAEIVNREAAMRLNELRAEIGGAKWEWMGVMPLIYSRHLLECVFHYQALGDVDGYEAMDSRIRALIAEVVDDPEASAYILEFGKRFAVSLYEAVMNGREVPRRDNVETPITDVIQPYRDGELKWSSAILELYRLGSAAIQAAYSNYAVPPANRSGGSVFAQAKGLVEYIEGAGRSLDELSSWIREQERYS